jgi:hypothetical protein
LDIDAWRRKGGMSQTGYGVRLTKDILTFLQKNPLEQRVLVPKHQTFVCCTAMALLEGLQRLLVDLDGALQLLYVFSPPLSESCLGLPVPLLALFGSGIYL